jgi:replicative DNA helicase
MNALARIDDAVLHNIALEQEALGTVLVYNSTLEIIEREVSAADFFEPLHSEIFEAFARVRDAHGTITAALVIASIGGDAGQIIVEGMTRGQYIARLASVACTAAQAQAYARQIREFSSRRKILAMAETMSIGIQVNQPAADIAGTGIELLDEIAMQASAGSTPQVSLREANDKSLARMQWAMQNPGKLVGMSWGLAGLDNKTGGLKRGELLVLAGRPGMGKTALALCVARSTAAAGEPTYFQSLEMGDVSLSDRNLADAVFDRRDPIPYYDIANGLNDAQARRVIEAARLQRDLPLRIDPAPGLTVSQIAARARRHKQILERQGLRLGPVIVDHMHIVKPSNRYSGARVNEVGEISAALKGLAKDLDVPVIALAQLSRKVEERDDKRPNMADLRDSGSIEQDADTIIFVFREAYYLERTTFDNQEKEMARVDRLVDVRDRLEAIIAKQRNGPTGTVHLFCNIACNAVRDQGGRLMRSVTGHINVARSIFDHPMFDDEPMTRREAWLWLIASAAWQPMRIPVRNGRSTELINLDRGQLSHSRSFMKAKWKWSSEKKVRTFLDRLARERMIDLQTGQLQTVITICNYDRFQHGGAIEGPAKGPAMGQQRAGNGPEEENIISIKEKKMLPPSPAGFDEWYAIYPRKKQPQDAKRAFAKAINSGAISLDALMAKTRAFAASWANEPKDQRKFIPYPASWLNAGSYDDEPDGGDGAEPAPVVRDPRSFTDADWQKRLTYLQDSETWLEGWGPKPGAPGCLVPAHLLITSVTGAA